MREDIADFLDSVSHPTPALRDPAWIGDLVFMSDITSHLNVLNTNLLIIEMYKAEEEFQLNVELWVQQVAKGDLFHFEKVKSLVDSLGKRLEGFNDHFHEFKTKLRLFTNPFTFLVIEAPHELQ